MATFDQARTSASSPRENKFTCTDLAQKKTWRRTKSALPVVVWLIFLAVRWVFIVDFYGDRNCTTNRSKRMCYCTYFNDSWSCPEKNHSLNKKYNYGYFGGDKHLAVGARLDMYFGWSIATEIFRSVLVLILLVSRIRSVCFSDCWKSFVNYWIKKFNVCCRQTPQSSSSCNEEPDNIVRSVLTCKELQLQWRIAVGFLLCSTVFKLIVMIMLGQCDSPTKGPLQQSNNVFRFVFMVLAAIYLAVEVKIGTNQVKFTMSLRRRLASGFLGLCNLSLVIDTLVHATCLDEETNANVLSPKVWTFLRPLFYIAEVGMYGQFFTMFVHIAIEPKHDDSGSTGSGSQGSTGSGSQSPTGSGSPLINGGERSYQSITSPNSALDDIQLLKKNLTRSGEMVCYGASFLVVIIVFTLSAVFLVLEEGQFQYVPRLQIAIHAFIIISSLPLCIGYAIRVWGRVRLVGPCGKCCATPTGCCKAFINCVCRLLGWLFVGDPERLVYVLYFLGSWSYNGFALFIYCHDGTRLNDQTRVRLGEAEASLAIFSALLQFLVVWRLKLLQEKTDEPADKKDNEQCQQGKIMCTSVLLKVLLTVSISLAVSDIIREEFDKDEKFFLKIDRGKFIYYDLLYPLAVEFRLHSAIMLFCIVLEDRLKNKQRKGNRMSVQQF